MLIQRNPQKEQAEEPELLLTFTQPDLRFPTLVGVARQLEGLELFLASMDRISMTAQLQFRFRYADDIYRDWTNLVTSEISLWRKQYVDRIRPSEDESTFQNREFQIVSIERQSPLAVQFLASVPAVVGVVGAALAIYRKHKDWLIEHKLRTQVAEHASFELMVRASQRIERLLDTEHPGGESLSEETLNLLKALKSENALPISTQVAKHQAT